jgi:thioredoxin-related protein
MDKNQVGVRIFPYTLALTTLILLLAAMPVEAQRRPKPRVAPNYIPVTEYDPKRNAAQDLAAAITEAQRTHKNVLIEVGGEWCSWCHTLDKFFAANPELLELRDRNFVTLKVNFSDENENQAVLSRFPPIGGYPHMFFLNSRGKLLLSQDTGLLENGRTYNLESLTTVLTNWGPKP